MKRLWRWWPVGFVLISYFVLISWYYPWIWKYQVDEDLLERYSRSQDIPHEVPYRIFLSDSEIHMAAGLLYASGKHPLTYNFQHPPLGKYLYGMMTLLTGDPLLVQILAGAALLIGTYALGVLAGGRAVGILGAGFLVIDPLFLRLSSEALLDLIQAVWVVFYFLVLMRNGRNYWLQGLLMGLIAMTKFWTSAALILLFTVMWRWWFTNLWIEWKRYGIHVGLGGVCVVLVCYLASLLQGVGIFELGWWQLKIFKYWLHHSVASLPGNVWLMWFSGWYKNWWPPFEWLRSVVWSVFWPFGGLVSAYLAWKLRDESRSVLFFGFPIFYLAALGIQAPFERYFIILLPFTSVAVSAFLIYMWKQIVARSLLK